MLLLRQTVPGGAQRPASLRGIADAQNARLAGIAARVVHMDALTGAVVIAGLKYAGPPAASVVTNFLNRILSPAGDAIGEAAAYPIQEWQRKRVERAQVVVTRPMRPRCWSRRA